MQFNPFRAMIGGSEVQAGTSTQNPWCGLYNNATDGRALVVRQFYAREDTNTYNTAISYMYGNPGSIQQNRALPLVSGGPVLAGQITQGYFDVAPAIMATVGPSQFNQVFPQDILYAVVMPGWTFTASIDFNNAVGYRAQFIWEVLSTEEMMARGWSPEFQPPIPPNWND